MWLSVRLSTVIYLLISASANSQITLPTDVSKESVYCCYAPKPDDWSGNTMPPSPNNMSFEPDSVCDFYIRAEEMFSWLTTPSKGVGEYIFTSDLFYGVSSLQENRRYFTSWAV